MLMVSEMSMSWTCDAQAPRVEHKHESVPWTSVDRVQENTNSTLPMAAQGTGQERKKQ